MRRLRLGLTTLLVLLLAGGWLVGQDKKEDKGATKTELVVVPIEHNRYLIHRELGIYGRLGVVCDEM